MRQAAPLRTDVGVVLLYGPSLELRRRRAEELLAAWIAPEDRELALVRLWGKEATAERVRQETVSLSLLSPRKVVVIESAEALPTKEQEALAEVLGSLAEGARVLFISEAGEKGRQPLGAALARAIEKAGQVVDCSGAAGKQLEVALLEEAERLGKRLQGKAAVKLAQLTGDFDTAYRELEKLALYTQDRGEITEQDVEAMTSASAEANIFQFLDELGMRNARMALRHLETILPPGTRRGAGQAVVGSIARQLRLIWQAKALRDHREEARSEEFRARFPSRHNYFEALKGKDWMGEKLARQAARFTHEELARALLLLNLTDQRLKGRTEENLDDRTALQLFVAEVCK